MWLLCSQLTVVLHPCLPSYVRAVSPAGMSDYAEEGAVEEGPSPLNQPHRAFSSHHLQQIELAAALEGGRADVLSDGPEPSPGQAAAAAAAARVHGLRDDMPPR